MYQAKNFLSPQYVAITTDDINKQTRILIRKTVEDLATCIMAAHDGSPSVSRLFFGTISDLSTDHIRELREGLHLSLLETFKANLISTAMGYFNESNGNVLPGIKICGCIEKSVIEGYWLYGEPCDVCDRLGFSLTNCSIEQAFIRWHPNWEASLPKPNTDNSSDYWVLGIPPGKDVHIGVGCIPPTLDSETIMLALSGKEVPIPEHLKNIGFKRMQRDAAWALRKRQVEYHGRRQDLFLDYKGLFSPCQSDIEQCMIGLNLKAVKKEEAK
jgi:hypothetical protein